MQTPLTDPGRFTTLDRTRAYQTTEADALRTCVVCDGDNVGIEVGGMRAV
ncbi:MAG TPA: hypothetical protein VJV03_00400 [Pyrinomonadaceae bacterium]|nr:hypothetical protein [Pyrinomonadaceae bacterium]